MIQVKAKDLLNGLKSVKRTKFESLPVLNHVLMRLTDDGMELITVELTDEGLKPLSATVKYWGNGERWETCAPMQHKYQAVEFFYGYLSARNAPKKIRKAYPVLDYVKIMAEYDEILYLSLDEASQILHIKTDTSRAEFKCLDAREFPIAAD